MAFCFELGAQLDVVVDFAVEYQPESAVLVAHGLEAGVGQVDNAQMAVGKAETTCVIEVEALAVGAAMSDGFGHTCQHSPVGRLPVSVEYACNAAHGNSITR